MKKPQFTRAEILEAVARLALADEIETDKQSRLDAIDENFTLTERIAGVRNINEFMIFVETKLKLYDYFLIESMQLNDKGYVILYRTLDI